MFCQFCLGCQKYMASSTSRLSLPEEKHPLTLKLISTVEHCLAARLDEHICVQSERLCYI